MMGLRGQSYQCFLRTKIGSWDLYSTKGGNFNFHSFVQSFDFPIRSKAAPPWFDFLVFIYCDLRIVKIELLCMYCIDKVEQKLDNIIFTCIRDLHMTHERHDISFFNLDEAYFSYYKLFKLSDCSNSVIVTRGHENSMCEFSLHHKNIEYYGNR